MLRRFFTVVRVVMLIACVAAGILWASGFWDSTSFVRETRGHHFEVFLAPGGYVELSASPPPLAIQKQLGAPTVTLQWQHLGFRYSELGVGSAFVRSLAVPRWFVSSLVIASAILLILIARRRWSRTPLAGHCRKCGYDIRATPGRCPECGAVPKVAA